MVCTHHTLYSIHTLTWLENSLNMCSQSCIVYDFVAIRVQTLVAFGVAAQNPFFKCSDPSCSKNPESIPALLTLDYVATYCLVVSTEVDDIIVLNRYCL